MTPMNDLNERYGRDGYFIFDEPVLDANLVRRASTGMDMIRAGEYDTGQPPRESPWNPGDDLNILCKIELPQLANRAIREVVSSPEIGRWAAATTGASMVQVFWVQFLFKPPAPNDPNAYAKIGWHQDINYWNTTWEDGSQLLTAWLALSDVSEDSGPMTFVRGSHHWGVVEGSDFFGQELDRDAIQRPPHTEWEEVPALMPAGAMSLHDWMVFHGSDRNTSSQARRSLAIHLRTNNSRPKQEPGEHLLTYIDDPAINPVIFGTAS